MAFELRTCSKNAPPFNYEIVNNIKKHLKSSFYIFCGKFNIATSVYRCLCRRYCAVCIDMYILKNAGFLAIMWNGMQVTSLNANIYMRFDFNALQSMHVWKDLPPTLGQR